MWSEHHDCFEQKKLLFLEYVVLKWYVILNSF